MTKQTIDTFEVNGHRFELVKEIFFGLVTYRVEKDGKNYGQCYEPWEIPDLLTKVHLFVMREGH